MRRREQLPLIPSSIDHPHARELEKISQVLDENGELAELIEQDLVRGVKNPHKGSRGMSGDQVFRVLVLKQMNDFSYEELEFHLKDSGTYRSFCRIGAMEAAPARSTLAENLKKVRPETLEKVNRWLLKVAEAKRVEQGDKVRIDSTVVESHIHRPSDSVLLYDGVRVISRLLKRVRKACGFMEWRSHTRRAKRRMIEIHRTRREAARKKSYVDLLKAARKMLGYARAALAVLAERVKAQNEEEGGPLSRLRQKLEHFVGVVERVREQTEKRVLQEQKVPTAERVVSIFEPHADVLVKDHRDTYYGHKISLAGGASGMVLDCVIEDGNPNDATRAIPMLERQVEIYKRAPRKVAMDGTYTSEVNLEKAKGLGVEEVCFTSRRGLEVEEMTSSRRMYRLLRNFRAGIEASISFLKRCFGLRRCTWRGELSFKSYVWSSVVSANLLILARHLLK